MKTLENQSRVDYSMDELIYGNADRYTRLAADAAGVIFNLTGIDLNSLELIENEDGTEVVDVCKAWDDHKELGRREGVLISVRNLMESTKTSAIEAMEILKVSEEEREMYLAML